MTRTLDEESNSPLRNLNEEQFISLGHSFDQRKRGRERRQKIRETRMEEGHHRYPLFQGSVQMTTHFENRIYSLENGTRLLNRETFRAGCVQESGNWLRFRSRPHRGIALSLFPQLAEFLGRISRAGTRPTSRLDEKGHRGRRGGKFGNCLSAGYPQTVLRVSRGSGINGDNAS